MTTHTGYEGAAAFDIIGERAVAIAHEYGDDISAGIYGLEIDGPNGTANIGRHASDGVTIKVRTLGMSAESTEDARPSWTATFGPTTPAALLRTAARHAIEAIN